MVVFSLEKTQSHVIHPLNALGVGTLGSRQRSPSESVASCLQCHGTGSWRWGQLFRIVPKELGGEGRKYGGRVSELGIIPVQEHSNEARLRRPIGDFGRHATCLS